MPNRVEGRTLELLVYFSKMYKVGDTFCGIFTKLDHNEIDIDYQAYIRLLRNLAHAGYIFILDRKWTLKFLANIDSLPKDPPSIHHLSGNDAKNLDWIVSRIGVNQEREIARLDVMNAFKCSTEVSARKFLEALSRIDAIQYIRKPSSYYIVVRRVSEEYYVHDRLNKEVKTSLSAKEQEIQRLKQVIADLTARLFQYQLQQKPIAWLWKKKTDNDWKEVSLNPPSKMDLEFLDFLPVYKQFSACNDAYYKHMKTGGVYRRLGEILFEHDLSPAIVYQSCETGQNWGRIKLEFEDGRFEPTSKPE